MATDLMYKLFDQFLENLIFYGLEYFNRYYSVYPGVVLDNADPEKQGRVLVKCPNVTSGDDGLGEWAWPLAAAAGPQGPPRDPIHSGFPGAMP